MGSVYVTWCGTCHERAVQDELLTIVRHLAGQSSARLGEPTKRPAFLQVIQAEREGTQPAVDVLREFDGQISGRIVLDPALAADGEQALLDAVRKLKGETVFVDSGGMEKNEPYCISVTPGGPQTCLMLRSLRVYGVDFQLFDPRGLYPDANRVSFVFLQSDRLPSLNGRLAMIEGKQQLGAYESEMVRGADWLVSSPSIHLRYFLEEWMDRFLGCVKFFFVPDLEFNRYGPLPQYEKLAAILAETAREEGMEGAKYAAFNVLMDQFEEESDGWTKKIAAIP